jgi:hypothetical protein
MLLTVVYVIFFMAFFANSLVWFNIIPSQINLLSEILIYLLLIISIIVSSKNKQVFKINIGWLGLLFLIVAVSSCIINNYFNLKPIVSLRLIFRFYIFYIAIINLNFSQNELKKINNVLFFFFILQIPAVIVKFIYYGVSEYTTGTYNMVPEGKTTMMIPIIALGFLIGYYFYYKKSKIFLLLGTGYIFFGIVSAKLALIVLFPMLFFGSYLIISIENKSFNLIRTSSIIILMFLISLLLSVLIIKYQPRVNREREVGGTVDFSFAWEYSKNYANSEHPMYEGAANGRYATAKLVMNTITKEGWEHFAFGFGPGSITKSSFNFGTDSRTINILRSYGVTGMTYLITEYGIFGLVIFIAIFLYFISISWHAFTTENDPYWKSFSFGSIILVSISLFSYLFYSVVPISGDTIPPVLFYVCATIYIRNNFIKKIECENT